MEIFFYILYGLVGLVLYCIAAWGLVFVLALSGKIQGEGALGVFILAPIMPFIILKDVIEEYRYARRVKRFRKVSAWIAENLREKGIEVVGDYKKPPEREFYDEKGVLHIKIPDGYNALHDSCDVK